MIHDGSVHTGPAQSAMLLVRKPLRVRLQKHAPFYLMLLPAMLYFLIFRYAPIAGMYIAFVDFVPRIGAGFIESLRTSEWVGLHHFQRFLNSPNGFRVIRNTFLISFQKLIVGFPVPIIFALLLNELRSARLKKTIQTISYFPHLLSWVIVAGILKLILSPDYGAFVPFFRSIGLDGINFIGDPRLFRGFLVVTDVWKSLGYNAIIYLAAISTVDPDLYEAATVDGAGIFSRMRHVTLPSISTTVVALFVLTVGRLMVGSFDQVFNLYNPGVYAVGDIISTFIYRNGLISFRFSYATAVGMFQAVIVFSMVMTSNWLSRRLLGKGLW